MVEAHISYSDHYLPEIVVSNEDLNADHPEWSVEKISGKTGIIERRYAAKDETSGDLAFRAADKLFNTENIDRSTIDYLILCTQSPDYFLPTTACILQSRLGLNRRIGAIDINLGCSGFVYGLGLAKGLVETGQAKNVLLITAETYSKFIHPNDKKNKTLFGDAAAATVVSSTPPLSGLSGTIQQFTYETDGSGAEKLIVKNGAFRNPVKGESKDTYIDNEFASNDDFLFMDGKAIFDFTVLNVPKVLASCLDKNGITPEDVDLFIFHQANEYMLETVRRFSKIPKDKFYIFLKHCGNTVSSTIPIALKNAINEKRIKKGDKVVLCGFGVGLSVGACLIQY